jgi:hypothetical protein
MNKGGLIGIAVVLAVLAVVLSGVIIWQHNQLSAAIQAEVADKAHNAELQKKVESLEQEVSTLKETADFYYKQGVDQQSSGNMADAKAAFEAVITKFPTSNLVGSARQRLAAVNEAIATAEASRAAEGKQRQEYEAIPEYSVEELGKQYLANSGRFAQTFTVQWVRMAGKLEWVDSTAVGFAAGQFLAFYVDAAFDTTSLNAGDYVEVVVQYSGQSKPNARLETPWFFGRSVKKL